MENKEKDYPILKGEVTKISEKETDGKKKFGVQINNNPNWFNGWGSCPCQEGDLIEFKYDMTEKSSGDGYWYNFKQLIDVKSTHSKPDNIDIKTADQLIQSPKIDDLKYRLENDYLNRNVTLMKCAVDLCMKRNGWTNDEIMAEYTRLRNATKQKEIIVYKDGAEENIATSEKK